MTTVVFHSSCHDPEDFRQALLRRLPDARFVLAQDDNPSIDTDDDAYAIVLYHPYGTLKKYRNMKAILSIAAGVDHLLADADLPKAPIYRQTDSSLQDTMCEYALMAVLLLHRDMNHYITQQQQRLWHMHLPLKRAQQTTVGILGIGHLGMAIAEKLQQNGFPVLGWSRQAKANLDFDSFHGSNGLEQMLPRCSIVLSVLPHTAQTDHLINASFLSMLPKGASVINIGRGGSLDLTDLMNAIDNDHIAGAVLDVYPEEPLPKNHPVWQHPRIIMTPHIAGDILMDTAIEHMLDKLCLLLEGKQPDGLYSHDNGY